MNCFQLIVRPLLNLAKGTTTMICAIASVEPDESVFCCHLRFPKSRIVNGRDDYKSQRGQLSALEMVRTFTRRTISSEAKQGAKVREK